MTDRTHNCNAHEPSLACYGRCRCRCYDCCYIKSDWDHRRTQAGGFSVDATLVADQVRALYRAGWNQRAIANEADLRRQAIYKITSGQREWVQKATAEAIADLHSTIGVSDLDPAPLVAAVEARRSAVPMTKLIPDTGLRRAYYRAAETGRITLEHADRIATEVLATPHLLDQLEPIGATA